MTATADTDQQPSPWCDVGHLRHRDRPLSADRFRHDHAQYIHPSHLAAISPMLEDPIVAEQLAGHHRVASDLSRLIADHFGLSPADDVDVEKEGRRLVLTLDQDGTRRILLIGACCLICQIRQVVDGPRVSWLMTMLSEPGYLGALDFGRSQSSDSFGSPSMAISDCQSATDLERELGEAARRAFGRWLAIQEPAFRERATMIFPRGVNLAAPTTDLEQPTGPLADIMTLAADIDLAVSDDRQPQFHDAG